ncbi:MAG: hypothetical protein Q7K35_05910 [bacterium]|nr:hypothetical protein [bacterium]
MAKPSFAEVLKENFHLPSPDAADSLEVVGHSEADLHKGTELNTGETLLDNTLDLIKFKLRMETNETLAEKRIAELRQDKTALNKLKAELLENINLFQGDDKREAVAERVALELISRSL